MSKVYFSFACLSPEDVDSCNLADVMDEVEEAFLAGNPNCASKDLTIDSTAMVCDEKAVSDDYTGFIVMAYVGESPESLITELWENIWNTAIKIAQCRTWNVEIDCYFTLDALVNEAVKAYLANNEKCAEIDPLEEKTVVSTVDLAAAFRVLRMSEEVSIQDSDCEDAGIIIKKV